jgi:hypothetical protein
MAGLSATGTVLLLAVGYATPALAGSHHPSTVVTSGDGIGIHTSVSAPGSAAASAAYTAPVSRGSGVSCTYSPDISNHSAGIPDWETRNPHTGQQGAWFFRQCTNGSFTPVWIPAGNSTPAVPRVTPGQLATQAVNYLPLPAPAVHHSPDFSGGRPQTVVGIDTWFWVSPSSFTRLVQTTSAGGVSATVTARPVSTVWATGSADAPGVVCDGPGVAYDVGRAPSEQSTYCSTTYARSSAGQPRTGPDENDRFFVGSATTVWHITWTGTGGATGTLPDLRRSTPFRLAVAELQAVNR